MEREKTTLVANMKQKTMMRATQKEECQELSKVIVEKMCGRQRKLLTMMERNTNLMSEAPEDLRKPIIQEIRDMDEKSLERRWNCWRKSRSWRIC